METFKLILSLIPLVFGAVTSIVTVILSLKAKAKAKKAAELAQTEAEKAQAEADLKAADLALEHAAKQFISDAEVMYKTVDELLKARGQSAGALKKETVIAKLQTYAIEQGYTLDVAVWSDKIDELVKFTKAVNAKN